MTDTWPGQQRGPEERASIWGRPIDWLLIKNIDSSPIPPGGVCRPVGANDDGSIAVTQPIIDSQTDVLFNGEGVVPPGQFGQATRTMPAIAAYQGAPPVNRDIRGAKKGSWYLSEDQTGFEIMGVGVQGLCNVLREDSKVNRPSLIIEAQEIEANEDGSYTINWTVVENIGCFEVFGGTFDEFHSNSDGIIYPRADGLLFLIILDVNYYGVAVGPSAGGAYIQFQAVNEFDDPLLVGATVPTGYAMILPGVDATTVWSQNPYLANFSTTLSASAVVRAAPAAHPSVLTITPYLGNAYYDPNGSATYPGNGPFYLGIQYIRLSVSNIAPIGFDNCIPGSGSVSGSGSGSGSGSVAASVAC